MMQQALHTWIWGFSAILLCRSSQALSGWMEDRRWTAIFRSLQRWVRLGSSQGSGWATQGHSQSCPEATPSILLAVCLGSLSCWKVKLWSSARGTIGFLVTYQGPSPLIDLAGESWSFQTFYISELWRPQCSWEPSPDPCLDTILFLISAGSSFKPWFVFDLICIVSGET